MTERETSETSWVPGSGQVVAGRYRVERPIGSGGMGAVVSATHIALGERVALKFLDPRLAATADAIERFVREARATSRIKSEHVVRVTDVGSTDTGIPFIAMELLEGEDLAGLVSRGPVALDLATDCVLQAAEALSEAHAVGVVHRDIKPSNLWLTRRSDGTALVKILDFGISKLAKADETNGSITATQAVFGSPTYMSPEQIRSSKRVDHRTDVWALGIVLHELLTTRIPFDGESVAAVLAGISADAPVPLSSLRPDLPIEVEIAILRCLEKDPSRRSSLAELAERLAPFASHNGRLSVSRIPRIGTSSMSVVAPPPQASSQPGSATLSMSATEPNVTVARTGPGAAGGHVDSDRTLRHVTVAGVALFALAALTLVGVGLVKADRKQSRAPTTATVSHAAPDPRTAIDAEPSPSPTPSPSPIPPAVVSHEPVPTSLPAPVACAAAPPTAASKRGAPLKTTAPPLKGASSARGEAPGAPPAVATPPVAPTSNLSDDRR